MACPAGVPGSGRASVARFSNSKYFITWFLPRRPVRLPLLVERAGRGRTRPGPASARRPGPELIGVAYRPDVRDLVTRDLEREHGHGDAVFLGHQAGLAVDRALQDRQAAGYPAGDVGQGAGHLLAALDGGERGGGPGAPRGGHGV